MKNFHPRHCVSKSIKRLSLDSNIQVIINIFTKNLPAKHEQGNTFLKIPQQRQNLNMYKASD